MLNISLSIVVLVLSIFLPSISIAEANVQCFVDATIGGEKAMSGTKIVNADAKDSTELDESALPVKAPLITKFTKGNREVILTVLESREKKDLQISVVSRVLRDDGYFNAVRNRAVGSEKQALLELRTSDGPETDSISIYAKCIRL